MSFSMDSPTIELMSALASMFQSGKYSDLTIVCGSKRYPVHRALLASRSSFFDGACSHSFQEARTGVIDLTEDDAEAVEHMVHYFYHLDYLNKPLSRRSSQRSSRPTSPTTPRSSRFPTRRGAKKLNLALIEDPLLAMMSAANTTMPMTPPEEQEENQFDALDESAKLPASPMADELMEDPFDCLPTEPAPDAGKPHLITHAKVYAIAEKYGISGLKTLARKKFAHQIEAHIDSEELPEACQEAYESTVDTDRGLRDVVIQTFRSHPNLSLRKDMEMVVRDTPGLAFELFRMASGLPVAA